MSPRFLLASIALVTMAPLPASAGQEMTEDDCVAASPTPELVANELKGHFFRKTGVNLAHEAARFPDGVEMVVDQSGCADAYVRGYSFRLPVAPGDAPKTDLRRQLGNALDWLDRNAPLVAKTQLDDRGRARLRELCKGTEPFASGDYYCFTSEPPRIFSAKIFDGGCGSSYEIKIDLVRGGHEIAYEITYVSEL